MTAYHSDKTWIMDIKLKSVGVERKILSRSDVLEEKKAAQAGHGQGQIFSVAAMVIVTWTNANIQKT